MKRKTCRCDDITYYLLVRSSDALLLHVDRKVSAAAASPHCEARISQSLVSLNRKRSQGPGADDLPHRPSLLQDLLGPLQQSFAFISSHNGPQAESLRSQNPQEWKKQKTILLNSFWTWNAFVKEWRSVKVPVGVKLMTDVSIGSGVRDAESERA